MSGSRTLRPYTIDDLFPEQRRAVRRLQRALKAVQTIGLGIVADGDCGIRIVRQADLFLDDLRDTGFTISVDSSVSCGGTVNMEIGGSGS